MKKLSLIVLLIYSMLSYAQSSFNRAIEQLGVDLKYYPETKIEEKSLTINLFKETKEFCEENIPKINVINFNEFSKARSVEIKSKKPLGGNIYLRLTIEEWTFSDVKRARDFERKFKLIRHLDCLNKGGIEFWRVKEKMYLIISPATMFSYEFGKVKKSMNKILIY
ncbi:exported protein of unknown function [Tenacibaculum sp. 190130A14a]|uniref:Uncharacterized protein n=1 Tax=Tenacibaculum polynesiense TaxID=3137857 RepID=A0ABP1F219_9FLAO